MDLSNVRIASSKESCIDDIRVVCKCGMDCLRFDEQYLCSKCNCEEIKVLSEMYMEAGANEY